MRKFRTTTAIRKVHFRKKAGIVFLKNNVRIQSDLKRISERKSSLVRFERISLVSFFYGGGDVEKVKLYRVSKLK